VILKAYFANPAYRVGWQLNRPFASSDFQKFIDALISETKAGPPMKLASQWKMLMTQELAGVDVAA
jgi:hypothetical protein